MKHQPREVENMNKLFRKLSKKERAQSMVEFALIFPLLLLITYGIIEMGRMLFIYIALTNAAREGARHGAAAGDIGLIRTPHYADCDGILAAVQNAAFLSTSTTTTVQIPESSPPSARPMMRVATISCACVTALSWRSMGAMIPSFRPDL
jgi:Flp pilus assembly protein TadG